MKIRTIIGSLLILLALPHANVFAREKGNVELSDSRRATVVLQLRWRHQFQFAGYYAAITKGYYRDAGLNVIIKEGGYGKNTVVEVGSGRAQYGVTNSEILLYRLRGEPVVVLAAVFQHSPLVFLAKHNSGITNPQEMLRAVVKMTKDSRDVELHATLENEGIRLDQIEFVEGGIKYEDYFDDSIQVLSAYLTNEPFYLREKSVPYTIIKPIQYGIDFYGDCLFTSEKELKAHPERVKAFREASLRGWEYAMKNPDEIINLIKKEYQSQKSVAHLHYEAGIMKELIIPDLVELGHMNPGRWKHIADTFVRLDWAEPGYSLEGFIYEPGLTPENRRIRQFLYLFAGVLIFSIVVIAALVVFNRRLSREVEERRVITKGLQESQMRFRETAELLPITIFETDKTGTLTYVNQQSFKVFGYSQEDFLKGLNAINMVVPEDRERALQNMLDVLDGRSNDLNEYSALRKDGSSFPVMLRSALIIKEGVPVGLRGFILDMSESKIAEDALRESELKYRILIENIQDGLYIAQDFKFVYFNEAFTRITGYSADDLKGKTFHDIIHPDDVAMVEDRYKRRIRGEDVTGEYELRVVNKDKEIVFVNMVAGVVQYQGRAAVIGSIIDITEARHAEMEKARLEAQLHQAQRMEAVGALASGIAHDFNNILQVISAYLQLLHKKIEINRQGLKYLSEVDLAVERASDLVQRLLTFSRKVEPGLKPLNLNGIIKQTVGILKRTIPRMIALETDLADDLHHIKADPGQLERILMNIVANARDAMPDGGRLIIETKNTFLTEEFCANHAECKQGEYVWLRISDNGLGMDEDTVNRIFEPFFTTKGVGEGTGLGMFTVYGIIKSHGGLITCDSNIGEGTTFNIYLPVVESSLEVAGEDAGSEDSEIRGGEETLLVVDDEEAILETAHDFLTSSGYRVMTAGSGEDALEIYRVQKNEIDLVILDLGMPGMGGQACLKELVKIDPDVKVLVASGYSLEGGVRETVSALASSFISKPYKLVNMLKKVRDVIEKKSR